MFESSKEENLLMNKKIANQIEEIDRLQQENKSLKVNPHNLLPAFCLPDGHSVWMGTANWRIIGKTHP